MLHATQNGLPFNILMWFACDLLGGNLRGLKVSTIVGGAHQCPRVVIVGFVVVIGCFGSHKCTLVLGKFLGKVGQDLGESKPNRLHVDIFWLCFIHLRYIV